MTGPVDSTTLDPGRNRPTAGSDADVTELDPGRSRPAATGGPTLQEGLPAQLDTRFKIVRVLRQPDVDSAVYLAQERASGLERVIKLYREDLPDPRVRAFVRRRSVRHLVEVVDSGAAGQGRLYDVMEYLAGGSLAALRDDNPTGLTAETIRDVVRQVSRALRVLHAAHIVHRDVKPANIVVRTLSPLEVALVDFDISQYVSTPPETATDRSGTARYMPPEFISGGLVAPAFDWWSLGVVVLELATGERFLDGIDVDNLVWAYVTSGPVNVSAVVDPRIRLLCQGLLAQSDRSRWGGDEVERWLRNESPPVPTEVRVAEAVDVEAAEPFGYLDTDYRSRAPLAAAMTATWETAAQTFYGDDPEPLRMLERWLAQFPDRRSDTAGEGRPPADVRLLWLLRRMAPQHPPVYRGTNISWRTLSGIARQAAEGDGRQSALVRELWTYDLLPLLSTGAEAPGLGGGDGLTGVRERWGDEVRRWHASAERLPSAEVRAAVSPRRGDRADAEARMLAICLFAASVDDEERAEAERSLRGLAARLRLNWFSDLVQRPDGTWLAYRLQAFARESAARRDDDERAAARRRAWLRRNQTLREWSRRQNRPLALSWAVAGVFTLGVVCTLLVGVSDVVDAASDAAILDAWLAVVLAMTSALTVEALLGWEIGGRFHPRYSMLGAGLMALGRAARSIAGRGIALVVVVCVLGGAYLLTAAAPVATPLVAGGGVLIWAVWRYLCWRTDSARESEEIRRDARERLGGAPTPSVSSQ